MAELRIIFFIGCGVFVIGVLVACWGMRGRRVGDHPHCRRCGFDLFGRSADANVCSECGADTTRRSAIGIGRRERRTRLLWSGASLAIFSLFWSGGVGWVLVRNVDINRYKPVWLLQREMSNPSGAARTPAVTELLRRYKNNELSAEQVNSIFDIGLAVQRDHQQAWTTPLEDLMNAMDRDNPALQHEKSVQYASEGIEMSLEVRPFVRRDDPIPLILRQQVPRMGWRYFLTFTDISFELAGKRYDLPPDIYNTVSWHPVEATGRDTEGWQLPIPPEIWTAMRDGPCQIKCRFTLTIYPSSAGFERGPNFPGHLPPPLYRGQREVVGSFVVLDRNHPSNQLIDPPEMRKPMEDAFHPLKLVADSREGHDRCAIQLKGAASPMPAAMRVSIRVAGQEWVDLQPGCGRSPAWTVNGHMCLATTFAPSFRAARPQRVTIILRPAPEALANEYLVYPIWGREVVCEDVPVEWTDGT